MAFTREIKPYQLGNRREQVCIAFPQRPLRSGKHMLVVYIGIDIAHQFNLIEKDRIQFFIDDTNQMLWFIRKSKSNKGYKLCKHHKGNTHLRTQFNWKLVRPLNTKKHCVEWETFTDPILGSGLLIRAHKEI